MFEKFKKSKQKRDMLSEENVENINLDEEEINKLNDQAANMDEEEIQKHKKHFSETKLWEKIQKFAKKAGSNVVYAVLLLYFTLQKPEVPMPVKATIVGALGYFILPFDLIPDIAVGVGYVDDLGVLTAALISVAMYIDDDIKNQAKSKLADWFGDDADTSGVDGKI